MSMSKAGEYSNADLGIVREMFVGDARDGTERQELSKWVNFLFRCGFLLRTCQVNDARIVIALLLPTRELAAAFAAVGIILGSLKSTVEFLTWKQFLTLPSGTELYVRFHHKKSNRSLKGEVGEKKDGPYGLERRIKIVNGPKAVRGSSEIVLESTFGRLGISMTEHPKKGRMDSIVQAGTFLRGVSRFYKPNWLVSSQTEALVITNKAEWKRVCNSVRIGIAGQPQANFLADVLLASDIRDRRMSRIALSAPGKDVSSVYAPVAIIDGPRALPQWREVNARNLLVLADQIEFDEECHGAIIDMTTSRDDSLLPKEFAGLIDYAPKGAALAVVANSHR